MQVKSYNAGSVGPVEFDEAPFGGKVLYRTLKEAVVNCEANQRQGSASTKGRSEVQGTNKKPYRQKGTGRARAGARKSPIWRGGGVVFGPHPRDFSYHMPTKARRVALRSALAGAKITRSHKVRIRAHSAGSRAHLGASAAGSGGTRPISLSIAIECSAAALTEGGAPAAATAISRSCHTRSLPRGAIW